MCYDNKVKGEVKVMARTITKSGSKEKVTCPVCGKVYTKAGLIGHMRWKHGIDHKAPSKKVKKLTVLRGKKADSAISKAELWDTLVAEGRLIPDLVAKGITKFAKSHGLPEKQVVDAIERGLKRGKSRA